MFQASLTSAQVLLPGSQASLSSLLLEGHPLLALATIMFAPGGIDQVSGASEDKARDPSASVTMSLFSSCVKLIIQGQRSGRSEWTVDPQVLKMALAPYPKLKAALFPGGPRGHSPSSDVTVYHLLQVQSHVWFRAPPTGDPVYDLKDTSELPEGVLGALRLFTNIRTLFFSPSILWTRPGCSAGRRQTPSTPQVRRDLRPVSFEGSGASLSPQQRRQSSLTSPALTW